MTEEINVDNPKRKYVSEFAIHFYSNRWVLTPANQLMSDNKLSDNSSQDVINNSHIYLITKLPKLSFSKAEYSNDDKKIYGEVIYNKQGTIHKNNFEIPFQFADDATAIKISDYPHRELQMVNNEGNQVRYIPANILTPYIGYCTNNSDLRDVEVLYIGKSYSENKNRNIIDRLKNHSTLQKILAEVAYSNPDDEVYIITMEFNPSVFLSQIDGRNNNVLIDNERVDLNRFKKISESDISKEEEISLIEAGLIRYFQPMHNKTYKYNFPSQNYKILKGCLNLDFTGLVVEINTEELACRLFSNKVKPLGIHFCQFNLSDPEIRQGFFDAIFDTGSSNVVD